MNSQNNNYLASQIPTTSGISQAVPNTMQDFVPESGFNFADGNEMDISGDRGLDHPSPATISSQSRGGSTSQSSYSPGQQTEHHLPYRASPKMPPGHMQNPAMGEATVFPGFNTTTTDMFANSFATSGGMNEASYQQGFMMSNDWEFNALNSGTGLTPMADSTWDSMLESVTMGWDSAGPPHDHIPQTARSR
jgi:hypothetical protein